MKMSLLLIIAKMLTRPLRVQSSSAENSTTPLPNTNGPGYSRVSYVAVLRQMEFGGKIEYSSTIDTRRQSSG